MTCLILHKVTSAVGLHLAWHPSMIRPGTDVQTPPSWCRLIFTVTFLDANQPCESLLKVTLEMLIPSVL